MEKQDQSKKKKIGLLGGSFNPAHEGHLSISLQALEILQLDEIWWLVANQNPLKPDDGMASFDERLESAKNISADYDKIIVSDIEKKNNIEYSYDTITDIRDDFPENKYIWLMGADNMTSFDKWYNWRGILSLLPVAIIDRDGYKENALFSSFALEYIGRRVTLPTKLIDAKTPAWCFLEIDTHPQSSTNIRSQVNKNE